jgi:anti-sigma regulatory factor (Ser/Thr protein kinase)
VRSCLDGVRDLDAIVLLVSELATNAVIHARTSFEVTVVHLGNRVRVGVADASTARPVLGDASDGATSGRGLLIVDALSDKWGTDLRGEGTETWFEVGI